MSDLRECFEVLQIAAQHDAFGRYEEAAFLYMMSVDMFSSQMHAQPPEKRVIIEKKMTQYKLRAQQLSKMGSQKKETSKSPLQTEEASSQREQTVPSTNSSAELIKQRAKEALQLVKTAKEQQKMGGRKMIDALALYDKAIKALTEIIQSNMLPEYNQNLKKRLVFIENAASHLRTHLRAKTKFQEASYKFYMKADSLVEKALSFDELQRIPEAIRGYGEAAIYFKKAMEAEIDELAKKVIARRMHLCQKRGEQLSMLQKGKSIPGVRQVQGQAYEEEPAAPKSVFSILGEKIKSVVSNPTEDVGVVGVMTDEHPDTNGEWLVEVTIDDTKTMTNPVDASLNYTVYVMSVSTKVMRDGETIDTPSWQVIRRYHQFKMFHSKLRSMNIPELPDFPANHANSMTPQVVKERIAGFTKYFQSLINRPPNPELNSVALRFLRNTFKREEAAEH